MSCAVCTGHLTPVMDFGPQALAGGFLKPEQFAAEQHFPLRLGVCEGCWMVQIMDRVPPAACFGRYFYRSSTSATARAHFARYARDLALRFKPKRALEIGSNDGVMLNPLAKLVDEVVGMDPNGTGEVIRDYFDDETAAGLGQFDLIVANNVFAHMPDIHGATRAVKRCLASKGVFVFEVHYLGSVLEGQYDAVYHEHVFYHSLTGLRQLFRMHAMQVFDVELVPMHGGSIRVYAGHVNDRAPSANLEALRAKERWHGFDTIEAYQDVKRRALRHRDRLRKMVADCGRVAAYGAAGRANTLLQWCNLDLDYVVDDCEAKHGFYTPGTHLEISPPEALRRDPPDAVLLTAWTYQAEIEPKVAGFDRILPFPVSFSPAPVAA